MENAARAIIMAAGVLIAIVLLSFFAFLFRRTGESTADIYSTLSESEITEFNQQFLNYDWNVTMDTSTGEGKKLTVQDVATLINLAMDNNTTQKLPTEITVVISGTGAKTFTVGSTMDEYEAWLSENVANDCTYECHVTIANKLVSRLNISET